MTPTIYLSPLAAAKERILRDNFDVMVGWHGLVTKSGEMFFVDDILVYPQESSVSTTITSEQDIAAWYDTVCHEDFCRIRYHGCSYGIVPPVPSQTDCRFEENLAMQLKGDDYYIFSIVNDFGARNARIRVGGIRYENVPICELQHGIIGDPRQLDTFLADAKSKVCEVSYEKKI